MILVNNGIILENINSIQFLEKLVEGKYRFISLY